MPVRRIGVIGLAVGAVVPVPTAALALLWRPAEAAKAVLVPAAELLAGVAHNVQDWPAPLALGVVSAINGLLYAGVALAAAALLGRRTKRPGAR